MNILHITSHLNVGGVTSAILTLSKGQVARGHAVAIASDGGELEPWVQQLGASHWHVPHHTSFEFSFQVWMGAWQLSQRLRRERVDIIHAHTRVGQIVAERLSRWHRIPFVATWHGFFRQNPGRRWWPCTGAMTIAISESVRRHLIEDVHVPPERVALIHNGIDVSHYGQPPASTLVQAYRERWRLAEGRPVVGSVGRLAGGGCKGFDLLLDAIRLARKELPELELLLVGDGPNRECLERAAGELGIRDAVRFVGTAEDVRLPLAAMDVFVFPSRQREGFGLSLVEAMAAGRPVVAFRTGAVPEIVRHEQEGWLVGTEESPALAQAIVRLCRDRQAAALLGAGARQRVTDAFSVERMVHDVDAVYQRVLASEAAAR